MTARRLATYAVLAALALALSYIEGMLPPPAPLPGFRLGLANIVTLFALCALGGADALAILLTRVLLGAMFASGATALLFSLLGGLAALGTMRVLSRVRALSIYGVSVGGAAAHHVGQVCAAMLVLGSAAPLAYLPVLLALSPLSGALTAFVCALLLRRARGFLPPPGG